MASLGEGTERIDQEKTARKAWAIINCQNSGRSPRKKSLAQKSLRLAGTLLGWKDLLVYCPAPLGRSSDLAQGLLEQLLSAWRNCRIGRSVEHIGLHMPVNPFSLFQSL